MPFPREPLNPEFDPVDRVRLKVGDFNPLEVELSYELYDYFLLTSDYNENKAAILAAKALIAKYARAMEEETDDTKVKLQERYLGYKELHDDLLRAIADFEPYAGGLSMKERIGDRLNNDLRDNQVTVGTHKRILNNDYRI